MFLSSRAADAVRAFINFYLVPKHVPQDELGAVLPLVSFATTLSLAAYIFALTFMKEVNHLACNREFGRLKTLLRGVFTVIAALTALAALVAVLVLPWFLERIRVTGTLLGALVVVSAFLGCTEPIFTNALNALKKFKTLSLIQLLGAPVRLAVMLAVMPARALAGYFAGKSSAPVFSMVAALFALRRELSVPAEPYWTRPAVHRLSRLFLGMAAYLLPSMLSVLCEQTVLREQLASVDSAAYYMATRFSDISIVIAFTFLTVLFPYTAELAEQGRPTRPLVLKASLVLSLIGVALTVFFVFYGEPLMAMLPNGDTYRSYAGMIPSLIFINLCGSIQTFYTNTEVSAARFGFLKWWLPFHLIAPAVLIALSHLGLLASIRAFLGYFALTSLMRLIFSALPNRAQNAPSQSD